MPRGVLLKDNSAFKVRGHVPRVSHGRDGICGWVEEEDWCGSVCVLESWDLVLVYVSRKMINTIDRIGE